VIVAIQAARDSIAICIVLATVRPVAILIDAVARDLGSPVVASGIAVVTVVRRVIAVFV
jgi:hypothetical protein